jgi:hypothetical protein
VGERVGDDEVVSPHDADAELPDHLLRRHGADGGWVSQTDSRLGAGRGERIKEPGWMDAANSWRPAPGFIASSALCRV